MADVFISYKRELLLQVQRIAARLERLGVSVWFDQSIEVGNDFRQEIKHQLMAARAVIVLWSPECFSSEDDGWVRWEAGEARRRRVLVPTCVGPVALEPPFNLDQMVDLGDWMVKARNDPNHRDVAWREVLRRLAGLLDRPALDDLDIALGADQGRSLERWAAANPDDPYARKIAARERRGAARRDLILGCDFEIALPQHIHRFSFDRSRFIFFTVETGKREAPAPIRSLTFSADGQRCLVAGGDGVMRVVSIEDGRILFEADSLASEYRRSLSQFGPRNPDEVQFMHCQSYFLFEDRFCLFDVSDHWGEQISLGVYNWAQSKAVFSNIIDDYNVGLLDIHVRAISPINNKLIGYNIHNPNHHESIDYISTYDITRDGLKSASQVRKWSERTIVYFANGSPRVLYYPYFQAEHLRVNLVDLASGSVLCDMSSDEPPYFWNLGGERHLSIVPVRKPGSGIDGWSYFLWNGETGDRVADLTGQIEALGAPEGIHGTVKYFDKSGPPEKRLGELQKPRNLHPIGGDLAILHLERGLAFLDVRTGRIERSLPFPAGARFRRCAIDSKAGVAALLGDRQNLALMNLARDQPLVELPFSSDEVAALAFSSDSRRLAIGRTNGITTIHRLSRG